MHHWSVIHDVSLRYSKATSTNGYLYPISHGDIHKTNKFTKRIAGYRIPLKMGGCWFICLKWMQHIWSVKFISQISMNLFECKNRTANQLPWILADGRYNFGSCNCGRPCAFRSEKCLRWEVGGADFWWWRDEFFESLTFEDNDLIIYTPLKITMEPQTWCLEDEFPFGIRPVFRGELLNCRSVMTWSWWFGDDLWSDWRESDLMIYYLFYSTWTNLGQSIIIPS